MIKGKISTIITKIKKIPHIFINGFIFRDGFQWLQKAYVYPPIRFIKPYWFEKEISLGLQRNTHISYDISEKFKKKLKQTLNLNNVEIIPVSSGRTAFRLALQTLKKIHPERKEVIIPTYGCRGIIDPVVEAGLKPVFVDIYNELHADPQQVTSIFHSGVLACLCVHLCGKKMSIISIAKKAKQYGIFLIEDQCQNLGGEILYPEDSNLSGFSIYSFGIGKNLMATAGGALIARTYKQEIFEESKSLLGEDTAFAYHRFSYHYRSYFSSPEKINTHSYQQSLSGIYQYRTINPFDAELLQIGLDRLVDIIHLRQNNATQIIKLLSQFPELYSFQNTKNHIYTKLSIIFPSKTCRKDFQRFMAYKGIETEAMYTPLHLRDIGKPYQKIPLQSSESIYPRVLNIPVRPNLSSSEMQRIQETIYDFAKMEL